MCEVDVTCLVTDVDPFVLSHSRAEAGEANKWADALDVAEGRALPGLDMGSAKAFFASFGAWTRKEIATWTEQETVALVLQFAAGDLREAQSCCPGDGLGGVDWDAAEALAEEGSIGGRVYASGDRLYISLCN